MNAEGRVVFTAALECDLEFSAQILVVLVANKVPEKRLRIRSHVEGLAA